MKTFRSPRYLAARILPIVALCALPGAARAQSPYTWAGSVTGGAQDWALDANWSGTGIPNAIDDVANVTADFSTTALLLELNASRTVGTLSIGDTGSGTDTGVTVRSGTGTNLLIFDVSTGSATLSSQGAGGTTQLLSAGVQLNDKLNVETTSSVTISGIISETGGSKSITKTNLGNALTLSGNNTFSGGITVNQGTINMTGAAANTVLGGGTFTFANPDGGAGTTLSLNAPVSKTIANNFVQNNADLQTGTEFAQFNISGGSSGFRTLTFTGDFSTGASFFGGTAGNANGQSLFLNAQNGAGTAANEGTFFFTGDWSGYNGIAGGLATTNAQAFRLQSGSYVFDKSASTAVGGFQLQSSDATVSGKLIFSEDTTILANAVQFTNATGQRHSLGSRAGASSTVTASGAIAISGAQGANFFAQEATGKLLVSGAISGSGAGGVEINKSYTFTSADVTNSIQSPTGIVEFTRAAGNTYSGGTTVTAGTLLVSNTTGTATGTGAVSVSAGASLGGTGRIAPTGANGLTVTSGGLLGLVDGTAADLDIDLAGTGAASFASGATFKMELNAPGVSDVIDFAGLADASTVAFNSNVIDFTNLGGLAPGPYTLFTFDSAGKYNTDSLVIGTGLGAFPGSSFIYGASDIQLMVVPEPGSAISLLGGLAVLLGWRRRRS